MNLTGQNRPFCFARDDSFERPCQAFAIPTAETAPTVDAQHERAIERGRDAFIATHRSRTGLSAASIVESVAQVVRTTLHPVQMGDAEAVTASNPEDDVRTRLQSAAASSEPSSLGRPDQSTPGAESSQSLSTTATRPSRNETVNPSSPSLDAVVEDIRRSAMASAPLTLALIRHAYVVLVHRLADEDVLRTRLADRRDRDVLLDSVFADTHLPTVGNLTQLLVDREEDDGDDRESVPDGDANERGHQPPPDIVTLLSVPILDRTLDIARNENLSSRETEWRALLLQLASMLNAAGGRPCGLPSGWQERRALDIQIAAHDAPEVSATAKQRYRRQDQPRLGQRRESSVGSSASDSS